jgi:ABC-type multidrug transport system permease subunit
MAAFRIAIISIRLALRTRVALFFTFAFPLVILFAYGAVFAHGNPRTVGYLFGPVLVFQIVGSAFFGLGIRSVMERERGSLRRYRLAPIGPGTIVTSNLLANYILLLPTVAMLTLVDVLAFHMQLTISIFDLWVLVTVGAFSFAGFGLTIASIANTMQEAQAYSNAVWLPMLFLSGVTFPLPMLPHWVQRVATFLPATYLVDAFQGVMSQRQALAAHWDEGVALVIAGIFGLLFAWKLFRWEKDEKIQGRNKALALLFVVPFILMGLWMNTRMNPSQAWASTMNFMTGSGRHAARAAKEGSVAPPEPAPIESGMISDFDRGTPRARFGTGWEVSTDAIMRGRSTAAIRVVEGGAEGSPGSLEIDGRIARGSSYPWAGAIFFPGSRPFAPANLSSNQALTFWAKGDGKIYSVMIFSPELGLIPAAVSFAADRNWKRYSLPLAEFHGVDPSQVSAILFSATLPPRTFEFQIDGVELTRAGH